MIGEKKMKNKNKKKKMSRLDVIKDDYYRKSANGYFLVY